jgi:uncharacterized coiled-coil DUF342 family protein
LEELRQSLKSVTEENSTLAQDLQQQRLVVGESQQKIDDLTVKIEKYETAATEQKKIVEQLIQERDELAQSLQSLEEKLQAAEEAISIAAEKETVARDNLAAAEERFTQMRESQEAASVLNVQLMAANESLQRQVEELR